MRAPGPPRSPWQLLYGGAHRARRAWWSRRARRLPRPVVSVGNLHWGGAGKTPLTAALARWLRDQGRRPAILSRGYGRRDRSVRIVSTGDGPLLGPLAAGDEPVALAAELPGVAVVVAPDRYEAGRHALERLSPAPGIFLLDDGFSHLRLRRDVDLLAFPAADPFAGGRLPPGGRLREPLAAAARADAVLLTGAAADLFGAGGGAALAAALRPHGFRGPGFDCALRQDAMRVDGEVDLGPGARVVAVAGVARPQTFFAAVRDMGFEVTEEIAFPDHHPYPEESVARLARALRANGAQALVTTPKDAVKLRGRLAAPLAELPLTAEPEAGFWIWLEERLAAAGGAER
ncbi:MAG TPA: tetraacyldisaccharide 4'-kinase [Thermoanaerobaculia bacterium]|nr:tetraacyldisaccharide 4'-kinase [Thermoanaerobaculia bacterium]